MLGKITGQTGLSKNLGGPVGAQLPDANPTIESTQKGQIGSNSARPTIQPKKPDGLINKAVELMRAGLPKPNMDSSYRNPIASTQQVERTLGVENSTQTTLSNGLVLVRHYDPSLGSADSQCGTVTEYSTLASQIQAQISHYNNSDGTNKLMTHTTVHIYGPNTIMPNEQPNVHALTEPNETNYTSVIRMRRFTGYTLEGAFSHEMGHAYHNWSRAFYKVNSQPTGPGATYARFWEQLVSSNHTAFNPSASPWLKSDGTVENGQEQFANAFRYFNGSNATRGSSGNSTDPVIPGFENPASHPDWGKMFDMLPETCSYWQTYGLTPNTLSWGTVNPSNPGDLTSWYFEFQNSLGEWIVQWDYRNYQKYVGGSWQTYNPTYGVP